VFIYVSIGSFIKDLLALNSGGTIPSNTLLES
jgi:hypothetical protein